MKHVKPLSRKPAQAAELGIGQLVSVIAEILAIVGQALVVKNTPPTLPTSSS
jgi:hypothetical protein